MFNKFQKYIQTPNKSAGLEEYRLAIDANFKKLTGLQQNATCVSDANRIIFNQKITKDYTSPANKDLVAAAALFSSLSGEALEAKMSAHEATYQSLLMSWNQYLTESIAEDKSNIDKVFTEKRAVYALLTDENQEKAVDADKIKLVALNDELTKTARTLFDNKTNLDPGAVDAVFNAKKFIAKHLHALDAPRAPLDESKFEPAMDAIEKSKKYLTNEDNGRYRNPAEYTNIWNAGVSRTVKLANVLAACNQIVLREQVTVTRALSQGNLGRTVGGFMQSLTEYINAFMGIITTALSSTITNNNAPMIVASSANNALTMEKKNNNDKNDEWLVYDRTGLPKPNNEETLPEIKQAVKGRQALLAKLKGEFAQAFSGGNDFLFVQSSSQVMLSSSDRNVDIITLRNEYNDLCATHEQTAQRILDFQSTMISSTKTPSSEHLKEEKKNFHASLTKFSQLLTETACSLFYEKGKEKEIQQICDWQLRIHAYQCAASGIEQDGPSRANMQELQNYLSARCKQQNMPKLKGAMRCYTYMISTVGTNPTAPMGIIPNDKLKASDGVLLEGTLGKIVGKIQSPKASQRAIDDANEKLIKDKRPVSSIFSGK